MHYCISDIHGWWDKYEEAKKYITKDDTLYILGDVIDRGRDGIKILLDIQQNKNYVLIAGNHEHFLYNYIKAKESKDILKIIDAIIVWNMDCNGGTVTNNQIDLMSEEEVQNIKNIIEESYLIKRIEVNNTKFHLSHAFTLPYKKEDYLFKDAKQEERYKVLWSSIFPRKSDPFGKTLKGNEVYIFGHTPIQKITGNIKDVRFLHGFKDAEFYDIDCGCAYGQDFSKLALFCLETKSAIYI